MSVEEALSLCGRLLAKVLLDGDWRVAPPPRLCPRVPRDRHTRSLNTLDGALAALEQCRPGTRAGRVPRGAHEWPAIFGCDELRACDLAGCESWDEDERLTDANKASLVIDAVKHQLVSKSRGDVALMALKEGFQGADNCDRTLDGRPGPHAGQAMSTTSVVARCMTPAPLALRPLRGRPVSGGDAGALGCGTGSRRSSRRRSGARAQALTPVTDAVYARARGWLDALVRGLDPQTLALAALHLLGRKTHARVRSSSTRRRTGHNRADIRPLRTSKKRRARGAGVATVDSASHLEHVALDAARRSTAAGAPEPLRYGARYRCALGERQGRCEFPRRSSSWPCAAHGATVLAPPHRGERGVARILLEVGEELPVRRRALRKYFFAKRCRRPPAPPSPPSPSRARSLRYSS